MLNPDRISRDKLWDLAEPLQQTTRRRYRDLWQRLRSENAPLRVIADGELVSAPISFFDTQLMSYVTNDWQRVARVIGQTLVAEMDVVQVGDIVLAARVSAMAQSGLLEIQGKSALEMHNSLVRLPQ
jgi:protein-disulfide isomerase-like protein with CxxC motif